MGMLLRTYATAHFVRFVLLRCGEQDDTLEAGIRDAAAVTYSQCFENTTPFFFFSNISSFLNIMRTYTL